MTRPTRAETLAWLAAEHEVMGADVASGMVPPDITRPRFTHELHTNFAAIEADVDALAADLARNMQTDREKFIDLLAADLATVARNPGPKPVAVAVAARILQLHAYLGIAAVAGTEALVADAETRYRNLLAQAAAHGGDRVIDEGAQMGLDDTLTWKLPGIDEYRLDLAARRLAQTPHTAVLDAAAAVAYQLPGLPVADLVPDIVEQMRQLSPNVLLTTLARPAVQQADSLGRQGAMAVMPAAREYYASELNDKATCGPCHEVDGTRYPTLAEAKVDYPAGGYRNCMGGDRCRGTIVAVWESEQPAQ